MYCPLKRKKKQENHTKNKQIFANKNLSRKNPSAVFKKGFSHKQDVSKEDSTDNIVRKIF